MAAMDVAAAAAAAAPPPLSLSVHETLQSLQLENGLRFSDHARYRRFCTRRLRRLRQTQHMLCAKGKTYHGFELGPENCSVTEHLLMVLLLAERAWSFAMDLKTEASGGEDWKRAIDRRQFIRRMAKAKKWAEKFEAICAARCDARTQLEARGYAAWIGGHYHLEKEHFRQALDAFTRARQVCTELINTGTVQDADLFSKRIESLAPAVRWCAYNLGEEDPTSVDEADLNADDELASKLAAASIRDKESGTSSVTWGSRQLPIVSSQNDAVKLGVTKAEQAEKELRDHLAAVGADAVALAERMGIYIVPGDAAAGAQGSEEDLEKTEAKLFSRIFDDLDDAERAVDKELAKYKGMTSGDRVDSNVAAATNLKACLAWRRMEHMLHRNLRLTIGLEDKWSREARAGNGNAADSSAVEDLVHMYQIMQSLSQDMEELSSVKDYDELYNRCLATQAVTRCYRCYFLAESHLKAGRLLEAHKLFDHTQTLTGDAIEAGRAAAEAVADGGEPDAEARSKAWEAAVHATVRLEQQCAGGKARVLAVRFLKSQTKDAEAADDMDEEAPVADSSRDLMERVNDFDDGGSEGKAWQLQSVPPKLRALPGKPLFLDIAGNYLEFPNFDEKAGVQPEPAAGAGGAGGEGAEGGGGWFGWITG